LALIVVILNGAALLLLELELLLAALVFPFELFKFAVLTIFTNCILLFPLLAPTPDAPLLAVDIVKILFVVVFAWATEVRFAMGDVLNAEFALFPLFICTSILGEETIFGVWPAKSVVVLTGVVAGLVLLLIGIMVILLLSLVDAEGGENELSNWFRVELDESVIFAFSAWSV
jgi:hypothetical protein